MTTLLGLIIICAILGVLFKESAFFNIAKVLGAILISVGSIALVCLFLPQLIIVLLVIKIISWIIKRL